jgi:adenine-specific DNA methylase
LNPEKKTIYAIEDSFPIVEINRLAIPERNAFKPIYQMHKWFARRASCVFRAILLGCMKPLPLDESGKPMKSGAEVIMEEFYKDHTNDPDTVGKVILDPFMGGGTTVVEALRLGCKVIGIDLNPVAWFIVKTEVGPVEIEALEASFERLAERKVGWSGKPVRETLLDQYRTECPCCGAGREEADTIYTFWVKSAICTNPLCKKEVPLFKDYVIAAKTPSIRYHRDVECPACRKTFDWEVDPASLIAEPSLCVSSPTYSAGMGRTTARWAFSSEEKVRCPWCRESVKARVKHPKVARKKVQLTVLLCPSCSTVWQWRGTLPEKVDCPVCRNGYDPKAGNVPKNGWFLCPSCGHTDRIINSIRSLPKEELLPMHPYAIEGYCPVCAGDRNEEMEQEQMNLDGTRSGPGTRGKKLPPDHPCLLTKNNGKFFKRITPSDLARYQRACEIWEREKENLPYPKQRIPEGFNTNQMIKHHYRYWHQMFNPRQLLCLSTLLQAIDEEPDPVLKEMLLSAFFNLLNNMSDFTSYIWQRDCTRQVFARHDFAPKNTPCESSVWGTKVGMGNFKSYFGSIVDGVNFAHKPSDRRFKNRKNNKGKPILEDVVSSETVYSRDHKILLDAADSQNLGSFIKDGQADFVITDPPYASNVNYSELADFFYIWLRLILSKTYASFAPDLTPKAQEIIVNPTRGHTEEDFKTGLHAVFEESGRKLLDQGTLIFTFHHSEGKAWEALLEAVCEAGFEIDSIYPIQGEAESSLHLLEKKAISYDLIHVCRKRLNNSKLNTKNSESRTRSWAGIRQEIRKRAREEIRLIEGGRYGKDHPLSPADVNIVLIGKCLELYSRHYGAVVDHEGKEVPLHEALKEIRNLVDALVAKDRPLPSELEGIDPESRIYLLNLCRVKEIKSDEVHKATRGVLEVDDLIEAGLMIKGRAGRGRTFEVKQPGERFELLHEKFKYNGLVDSDQKGQ